MYISLIYRRQKNRQVVNLPLYILSAFFFFWGDLGALVVLFLWVTGHHHRNISKVVSQRSRAIVSDDLGLSTPQ